MSAQQTISQKTLNEFFEPMFVTKAKVQAYPAVLSMNEIMPNWWNPNVMDPETRKHMETEIKDAGMQALNPILVAPSNPIAATFSGDSGEVGNKPNLRARMRKYVIVDGEQRYEAAQNAGEKTIRVVVDPSIDTEYKARIATFRKDNERGQIEEIKEAEQYAWALKNPPPTGKKQTLKTIAYDFNVTEATVRHRLALLQVQPTVRDTLLEIPWVTPTHIEALAHLPVDGQAEFMSTLDSEGFSNTDPMTTRRFEEIADRIKDEFKERDLIRKYIQAMQAKQPAVHCQLTCPQCKKDFVAIHNSRGLPYVRDAAYHIWNLETAKSPFEDDKDKQYAAATKTGEIDSDDGKPAKKKPNVDPFVRSAQTVDDWMSVFTNYGKAKLPVAAKVTELHLSGKNAGGQDVLIHVRRTQRGCSVYVLEGKGLETSYDVEEKVYKSKMLQNIKSIVRPRKAPKTKAALQNEEQALNLLWKGYSPKNAGARRVEKRIADDKEGKLEA